MVRVMLVEDDRHVRRAVVSLLRGIVDVVAFETLHDARAALGETWRGYILDHGLPDGDGLSFAEEILAQRSCASIILFTAADPQRVEDRAAALGITYAHKVDGIAALKRLVAEWADAERVCPEPTSVPPDAP
jgi:DNA-binding response OmpR family regulator